MVLFDRSTGKAKELELLQKAKQLDDELRIIAASGYKSDFATERPTERFVLKPFMIQALFQPARTGSFRVGQG